MLQDHISPVLSEKNQCFISSHVTLYVHVWTSTAYINYSLSKMQEGVSSLVFKIIIDNFPQLQDL